MGCCYVVEFGIELDMLPVIAAGPALLAIGLICILLWVSRIRARVETP